MTLALAQSFVPVVDRGTAGSTTLNSGFKGWRSPMKFDGRPFDMIRFSVRGLAAGTNGIWKLMDASQVEFLRGEFTVGTGVTLIEQMLDAPITRPAGVGYVGYEPADAGSVLGYPAGGAYAANDADPHTYREYYLSSTGTWVAATPIGNYRIQFQLCRRGPFFTLPSVVTAAVGVELYLPFDGILAGRSNGPSGLSGLSAAIIGPKGKSCERAFRYTPVAGDEGSYSFTAFAWDRDGNQVATRSFSINVIVPAAPTASFVPCLLGDSTTAVGTAAIRTRDRFALLGGTAPVFVGSQRVNVVTADTIAGLAEWATYSYGGVTYTVGMIDPATNRISLFFGASVLPSSGTLSKVSGSGPSSIYFTGAAAVAIEGQSGKSMDWMAGSSSPLRNPGTGLLDFAYYRGTIGLAGLIDLLRVALGINDCLVSSLLTDAQLAAKVASAKAICAAYLADNPGGHVILVLPALCGNTSDGFGAISGTAAAGLTRPIYELNVFKLRWAMLEAFDSGAYAPNVSLGASGLSIDRYYGFERRSVAVSACIPDVAPQHVNHVHPWTVGYFQEGDQDYVEAVAFAA